MELSDDAAEGGLLYLSRLPANENQERLVSVFRKYNHENVRLGMRLIAVSGLINFGEPGLKALVLDLFSRVLAVGEPGEAGQPIKFSYSAKTSLTRVLSQLVDVQAVEALPQLKDLLVISEPSAKKNIQQAIEKLTQADQTRCR